MEERKWKKRNSQLGVMHAEVASFLRGCFHFDFFFIPFSLFFSFFFIRNDVYFILVYHVPPSLLRIIPFSHTHFHVSYQEKVINHTQTKSPHSGFVFYFPLLPFFVFFFFGASFLSRTRCTSLFFFPPLVTVFPMKENHMTTKSKKRNNKQQKHNSPACERNLVKKMSQSGQFLFLAVCVKKK